MRSPAWLMAALLATLAGCASQSHVQLMGRDSGKIYTGTVQNDGRGNVQLAVTLEGENYTGPMIRTSSTDAFGYIETRSFGGRRPQFGTVTTYGDTTFYKALLTTPEGKGLRCDLSSSGAQGGGVCQDDKARLFDVVFRGQ